MDVWGRVSIFLPSTVHGSFPRWISKTPQHGQSCALSCHMSCDVTALNSFQIMNAASYVDCSFRFKRFTAESLFKSGRILKSHERQLDKLHGQSICLNCLLILTAHKCLMFLINHRMLLGCCYYPNLTEMFIITEWQEQSMWVQITLPWTKCNTSGMRKTLLHVRECFTNSYLK